jgi:hypothetical protein
MRPESMQGRGTVTAPVPITVSVTAQHFNPGVSPTGVTFAFGPTDRKVVDKAVAAFIKVMEAHDAS